MKRLISISILVTMIGVPPFMASGQQSVPSTTPMRAPAGLLRTLDMALGVFAPTIGWYPPQLKSEKERRTVEKGWRSWATTFEKAVRDFPQDAQVLWRAGEFYRMGHNLDSAGAWEHSERYCTTALGLDPRCVQAHLTLGTLYVNTDPKYAPAAEKEFNAVILLGDSESEAGAHRGLVIAYYYQARFREAASEAQAYLKLRPDVAEMMKLKAAIEEQIKKAGQ